MFFLIYLLKMVIFHLKVALIRAAPRPKRKPSSGAKPSMPSMDDHGWSGTHGYQDISGYVFTLGIKPLVKMGIYRDL